MSYVPPEGPGRDRRHPAASSPRPRSTSGSARRTSGASEIGTAVGAAGMWSPDALLIEHRSLWGEIWRRFRRDKFAMIGVVVIILLVLVAVFAPWIAPHDPTKQYDEGLTMQGMPVGPSTQFPLGTDTLGRDLLSRLMYGARVSLVVGVLANGFALVLGVIFGLTAGYFRGGVRDAADAHDRRDDGVPHHPLSRCAGERAQTEHLDPDPRHRHRLLDADDARDPRRGAAASARRSSSTPRGSPAAPTGASSRATSCRTSSPSSSSTPASASPRRSSSRRRSATSASAYSRRRRPGAR